MLCLLEQISKTIVDICERLGEGTVVVLTDTSYVDKEWSEISYLEDKEVNVLRSPDTLHERCVHLNMCALEHVCGRPRDINILTVLHCG